MDAVHFSSVSDEWSTPKPLFDQISAVFGPFDLDPCANEWNRKAPDWYGANGTALPWHGNVFVNPPFSREKKMRIEPWIRKSWNEVQIGHASQVVMLIPARTETRIWHSVIWRQAAVIVFIQGRINFVRPDGSAGPAPFPSALVVFRPPFGNGLLPMGGPMIMAWEQHRVLATQGM